LIVKEQYGYMVAVSGNSLVNVHLQDVARGPRTVPLDEPLIKTARSVDTCFGD
jgi:hypothetical protein